jgi:hypothetical protein
MTTATIEIVSNTLTSYRVLLIPKLPEEIIGLRGCRQHDVEAERDRIFDGDGEAGDSYRL